MGLAKPRSHDRPEGFMFHVTNRFASALSFVRTAAVLGALAAPVAGCAATLEDETVSSGTSDSALSSGEEQVIEAVSHLRTQASWSGCNDRETSEQSVFNPAPGWVIVENHVVVHSSNNGSRSVSTLAGGLNFVSEIDAQRVYDEAIKLAAEKGDTKVKADLEYKSSEHLQELRKFQTTHNTIVARVSAKAHGSCADRKRVWEEISVFARVRYLGDPDRQTFARSVASQFGLDANALMERTR
jgi:hypothetical protein